MLYNSLVKYNNIIQPDDSDGDMESGKNELVGQLVEYLERTYAGMRSEASEQRSEAELTLPQLRTLMMLSQGPQRMGAIAQHLNSSLSSATSMIDRLLDKGLVERVSSSEDRRVVTCQLTAPGQEEIGRFWSIGRVGMTRIADYLSLEELRSVVEAMKLLYEAGQKAFDSP